MFFCKKWWTTSDAVDMSDFGPINMNKPYFFLHVVNSHESHVQHTRSLYKYEMQKVVPRILEA